MILDAIFRPRADASTLANPTPMMLDAFGIQPSASGVAVNEQTAMNFAAVWCAVKLLSDSFKSLRMNLCRRTSQGKVLVPTHPALNLINDSPNRQWTPSRLKKMTNQGIKLWGNGYSQILRRGDGQPAELWPLGPWRVLPKRDKDDEVFYEVRNPQAEPSYVDAADMLHSMDFSYDGMAGVSVIRRARDSIGLGIAAENMGNKFFGNNARPGVILEHPGKLSPEASQRLRSSWMETYGGTNVLSTAVLEEGMKATVMPMNNEDAQFLQTRMFAVVEIARWFAVSPHLLMDMTNAHYATAEQTWIEYKTGAVMPDADDFEEECDRKLLTQRERDSGLYFEFDMEGLDSADIKTQMEADASAVQNGLRSRNECRRKRGENPIDDESGDAYTIQVNMMNLDRVMDEPEPPDEVVSPPTPGSSTPEPPEDEESEPPGGEDLREAITAAHKRVFVDVIGRMVRKQTKACNSALKRYGIGEQFNEVLAKQEALFRAAIGPACDAYGDAIAATAMRDADHVKIGSATKEFFLRRALTSTIEDQSELCMRLIREAVLK